MQTHGLFHFPAVTRLPLRKKDKQQNRKTNTVKKKLNDMLLNEVVPRLRNSVRTIPKIGPEDDDELVADCTLQAARMMVAAESKDLTAFRRESALFLAIGHDIDTLLATRHEFLLGRWLADARSWGATAAEKAYYEFDARQIITTWHKAGTCLDDYANRQWNGLMGSYYLGRWAEYVKRMDAALATGVPLDKPAYTAWRIAFEEQWLKSTGEKFATTPQGDACETANRLLEKYRAELAPR